MLIYYEERWSLVVKVHDCRSKSRLEYDKAAKKRMGTTI
jgi:hypothetical protein